MPDPASMAKVEKTGVALLWLGAVLVSGWLVSRFILAWPHSGVVAIREIVGVILVGTPLMVIGAYLSMYRATSDLEIERTTHKAMTDLLADAVRPGKRREEAEAEIQAILGRLDGIERNLVVTTRDWIELGQRSAVMLRSQMEQIEQRRLENLAQTKEKETA